jgi:hypothetical protein
MGRWLSQRRPSLTVHPPTLGHQRCQKTEFGSRSKHALAAALPQPVSRVAQRLEPADDKPIASRILTWSNNETARLWDISPDEKTPLDKHILEFQVPTNLYKSDRFKALGFDEWMAEKRALEVPGAKRRPSRRHRCGRRCMFTGSERENNCLP